LSLADAAWFKGIYEKIYLILSAENRLPPPDAIYIAISVVLLSAASVMEVAQALKAHIRGRLNIGHEIPGP
jgi:hypothetical protein